MAVTEWVLKWRHIGKKAHTKATQMDEKDDKEGATYLKQVRYPAFGFSKGRGCTTKFNLCTEIG